MTIAAARKPQAAPAAPLFTGQSTSQPAAHHASPDDLVDDLLGIVAGLLPEAFTETLRAKADAIARERWGGDRPYIARRSGEGRSERNASVRRDHRHGASVPLLQRRYGLSRRQIHRLLSLSAEDTGTP